MTLVITHNYVSTRPVGTTSSRIYSDSWNANHILTGTVDASQLNSNVVQAVTNDTNVTGSITAQTLTLGWTGTADATRLNANVVQAITQDTNVRGAIAAQTLTFSWLGQLGLSRGGTNADLSATGGAANYLKQVSVGAAVTVGTIPASDIASGAALTQVNDTNVTLALGGTPATAALKATSFTMGWTGTLAAARGGFGTDVSAQSGVPLFAAGVPTFTSTNGSGNFARTTNVVLVTPALGTPSSGTLTSCTGLPLSTGVTGNLSVNNLNSGTSASSTTFWRGDGVWSTPAGGGTVTSSGSPVVGQMAKFTTSTDVTGLVFTVTPQGRPTFASGIPVMTTTTSGATAHFYTPYVGQLVPIYDGTTMIPTVFAEISQNATDTTKSPAAVAASKVYDLFVWNDSGTIRCTRGPAWTNDTTRGYTLTMTNGILLNTSLITNGPAALRGTFVGTVRSNGSSTFDFIYGASASGGTAAFFGVWSAYNRVTVSTTVTDSGTSYTYTSSTIRQARASAGNQVTFVSGIAEDGFSASYGQSFTTVAVNGAFGNAGPGLDSTTTFMSQPAQVYSQAATVTALSFQVTSMGAPQLGVHVVSANEASDNTNANTYNGATRGSLGFQFRL